jgi:hypothetical protein
MNNPTYLQKQYSKLTKKLNKAFSTGRFYEYTQYKQQQLLDKFTSYTLQMKKLGMVAAVGAAVAMATPASGQIIWQENTGMANLLPNDTMRGADLNFVDIDGDGDLDIMANGNTQVTNPYYYISRTLYYENTGSATNPVFTRGVDNFPDSLLNLTFVDIDGDGDQDCFASSYDYYSGATERCIYVENTGTASNPVFIKRPNSMNPLDTINNWATSSTFRLSNYGNDLAFTDIDGDGDQDAFLRYAPFTTGNVRNYLCLKNTGNTTQPAFTDTLHTGMRSTPSFFSKLNFADSDGDGDVDALIGDAYFQNQGSTGSQVSFQQIINQVQNPYSSIKSSPNFYDVVKFSSLVDIDGDGDLDVYGYPNNNVTPAILLRDTVVFLENRTIVSGLPSLVQPKLEIAIFPNPTTSLINLEQPLTGNLDVFNTLGQTVLVKQLEEEQQINLDNLDEGTYLLRIQTGEGVLEKKVILQ